MYIANGEEKKVKKNQSLVRRMTTSGGSSRNSSPTSQTDSFKTCLEIPNNVCYRRLTPSDFFANVVAGK